MGSPDIASTEQLSLCLAHSLPCLFVQTVSAARSTRMIEGLCARTEVVFEDLHWISVCQTGSYCTDHFSLQWPKRSSAMCKATTASRAVRIRPACVYRFKMSLPLRTLVCGKKHVDMHDLIFLLVQGSRHSAGFPARVRDKVWDKTREPCCAECYFLLSSVVAD